MSRTIQTQAALAANYINHIALVLDGSGSMDHLVRDVITVADQQIAHLAQRSKELDQETRVTVYTFEGPGQIHCLIYDKDVLRLPSIKGMYRAVGGTPLIDATLKAIEDLEKTPELYGEHAFLIYVLTDGAENASKARPDALSAKLAKLPDHWTLACFVPGAVGLSEAKRFGFPKDNIAVWDTSTTGVKEIGETIRRVTDSYMTARASGVRGYKNLFQMDTAKLTKAAVARKLERLHFGQYRLWDVPRDQRIDAFVESQTGRAYKLGEAFYQLTVPVKVQPQKEIAIYDKTDRAVYRGKEARQLLGMPNYEVKVSPNQHPNYDVFIQSTSNNRKLLGGQKVMVLS